MFPHLGSISDQVLSQRVRRALLVIAGLEVMIIEDPRHRYVRFSYDFDKPALIKHLAHCAHLHLRTVASYLLEPEKISLVLVKHLLQHTRYFISVYAYQW